MSGDDEAQHWFDSDRVSDILRISDPDKRVYRQFGLVDGSLWALAHPRVWGPWFRTAFLDRRGVGAGGPNWRQLTGVFLIHRGAILASIRHRNSAERPDYVAFVQRSLRPGATMP
jgi:hypothetical protein